jgi:hypothetical protein
MLALQIQALAASNYSSPASERADKSLDSKPILTFLKGIKADNFN